MAAVPPADRLLPAETLAFVTLADRENAAEYFANSPLGLLWEDPALKPFKENALARGQEWLVPLERALGFPLSNITGLAMGQVTFAVIGAGPSEGTNASPRLALLIDVRDKTNELNAMLDGLKKQWLASGKRLRNDVVRGVEFSTFFVGTEQFGSALRMVLPTPDNAEATTSPAPEEPEGNLLAMTMGQSGALLLVGTDVQTLGRISTRQTEDGAEALANQPEYKPVHEALTRNALAYAWMNTKTLIKIVLDRTAPPEGAASEIPSAFRPDRLIEATGIGALESIALKLEGDAQGLFLDLSLRLPQAERRGLFQMIAAEPLDASPPAFVPAATVNYLRGRWDGQKAWAALETMLKSVSPEFAGVIELGFSVIGKDQDLNYDFRKSFLGSLGDDLISIQPATTNVASSNVPATSALILIASPDPEQLAGAARAAATLLEVQPLENALSQTEFLGRKIYAVPLPSDPTNPTRLYFATNQGYLVFSTDRPTLEGFLSGDDATAPRLRDRPDLIEAAPRVGGMSTGLFGYEDQVAFARQTLGEMADRPAFLGTFLDPLREALAPPSPNAEPKPWIDLALLPPFETISQYFHFAIYSGRSDPDGITFKYFAPTPPKLQ